MPVERIELETHDTETLEARWDLPDDPTRAVVFCHPHPQQGGTMTAPLMEGITSFLVDAGIRGSSLQLQGSRPLDRCLGRWNQRAGRCRRGGSIMPRPGS